MKKLVAVLGIITIICIFLGTYIHVGGFFMDGGNLFGSSIFSFGSKGKQVTFKIKAAGNGLTYQWYRRKPEGKDWVAIAGAKKASYTFKATKKLNGYSYRCRVKNKAGTTDTKAAMLKVK